MQSGSFCDRHEVGVAVALGQYDASPPFSPAIVYPEYPFARSAEVSAANNGYDLVRNALRLLGCDRERFGSAEWNPLIDVVQPGDTVVVKPNFVRDFRESSPDDGNCLITHGSIIRAVLDYVYIALAGEGRIVIADAPQNDADFESIVRIVGLKEVCAFYRAHADIEIEVYDLRPEHAKKIDGVIVGHEPLPGDPAGYARVDLGQRSAFCEIAELCSLLYGSEYDTSELYRHHHDGVHEYLISRTVLEADCVISLPKLKTHKKTGITVNMKNLVGINGNKNWLPHHRRGTPAQGGDQFSEDGFKQRVERVTLDGFKRIFPVLGPIRPVVAGPIKAIGKRLFGDTNTDTIRSGNWYGNDTTWRMVMDLNRILHFAAGDGTLHDGPMRRFFSVVDGVIAGQGNGPLDAVPCEAGMVVAGYNSIAVDLTCARLMGFDYRQIPLLHRALAEHSLPLTSFGYADVSCASNDGRLHGRIGEITDWDLAFEPHFGWKGHIELNEVADVGGH